MGILLKIALFGLACWGIYVTARKWYRVLSGEAFKPPTPPQRPVPPTPPPSQPAAPPQQPAARRIVEDTQACGVCGAFFTPGAARCGQPNCPLPA